MPTNSAEHVREFYRRQGEERERERIIKLLVELKSENLLPEQAISKGWKFDEPAGIWWLPQDILIDLIEGVSK
ncbi:MAG: hypothetical protein EBT26_02655 [Microbacteriaceae bacterium]|nr:hypothetical protein [Microbacteriaceae bacterium]